MLISQLGGRNSLRFLSHSATNLDNESGGQLLAPKRMSRQLDYYFRHKDKVRLSKQRYYTRNKDGIRGAQRNYYAQNKDNSREYYLRNKTNILESKRRYYLRKKSEDALDSSAAHLPYLVRLTENLSWKTPEAVREYFDSVAKQLNISHYTDWYRISRPQILSFGGKSVYAKFGSLGSALAYAYPDIRWDFQKFAHRGKKAEQRRLRVALESLLPGVAIIEDYQHPELIWKNSDRPIELDLWIPKLQVSLEYQGEHHYHSLDLAFGPSVASQYSERDLEKLSLCKLHGITLIYIPFWWDGERESLAATLYRSRPDVFPVSAADPIPSEMPSRLIAEKGFAKVLRE